MVNTVVFGLTVGIVLSIAGTHFTETPIKFLILSTAINLAYVWFPYVK